MSSLRDRLHATFILGALFLLPATASFAQNEPLRPGEAYVTRFSGTVPGPSGLPVINPDGTVGSIIDIRAPEQPPRGEHWMDKPERKPVTAAQVGQVFGVVLDDARPPNIYLASTSAFGLHHTADGTQWMPGMWGPGGPAAVYRLDAANGYAPRLLTRVTLNGRANGGPGLGNLAYDREHKQLFVTDLETGMIHRIRAADGVDLGVFDHGVDGRNQFVDAQTGQPGSLPPITFDPASQAHVNDCPSRFDNSPQCWNLAASGRRVWGIAVHHDPLRNETRVYYGVWSSPAFGQAAAWQQASEDDQRNAVWSVRLAPDGSFAGDVRREFIMPDFFVKQQDIARFGYSQPVSDIAFAECGPRPVMLVAERGGIRNLGLAAQAPFAFPHQARALRYELDRDGTWRPIGRYDVGFYDRKAEGEPFERANCEGGAAFGLGYNPNTWVADPAQPDQFVWITGHSLCSPEAPCNLPAQAAGQPPQQGGGTAAQPASQTEETQYDTSYVDGVQGTPENDFEEVTPQSALAPYPAEGQASDPAGPNHSYLVDTDVVIDPEGNVIEDELARSDATKIGDVAIYQICPAPARYAEGMLLAPPVGVEVPEPGHGRASSHYRYGSHDPYWSHNRFGSHNPYWSHNLAASHNRYESHNRIGSHNREESHRRDRSHERAASNYHTVIMSREHTVAQSREHTVDQSREHTVAQSKETTHSTAQSKETTHSTAQSAELVHSRAASQATRTTRRTMRRTTTTITRRLTVRRAPTFHPVSRPPSGGGHGGGGHGGRRR